MEYPTEIQDEQRYLYYKTREYTSTKNFEVTVTFKCRKCNTSISNDPKEKKIYNFLSFCRKYLIDYLSKCKFVLETLVDFIVHKAGNKIIFTYEKQDLWYL